MITMHFQPDYAIDNPRANNYICHFSVFSRELLDGTELFRTKFDGDQDHDMILRLTDNAKHIVHAEASVLLALPCRQCCGQYRGKALRGRSGERRGCGSLRRHGFKNFTITSTRAFETILKSVMKLSGNRRFLSLFRTKDHVEDLRRCISSIVEKSTWENYEIIVVENNSENEGDFSLL